MTILDDTAASFERMRPRLIGYARRRLPDACLAEDCAQEVLARAVELADRFEHRGPGSYDAWLVGIARRVVLEMSRAATRTISVPEVPDRATAPDVEDAVIGGADRRRLAVALGKLSDAERRILHLRYVEERDAASAGEEVGMEPGALRMAQLRASRRLRVFFDATGDTAA
jgi:RNA polymerase sigma-70 factor (ECF subfamily)